MRWYVFLFTALCVIGLPRASLVVADNGPHDERFVGDTVSCATCHQPDTAPGPNLLWSDSQYDVCIACHDGTGAKTNVVDGVYLGDTHENEGLRGGGFVNVLMDVGLTGAPERALATSTHIVDGTPSIAWGGGPISNTSSYGNSITLECSNCHNPHGNGQYRILRRAPSEGYGTTEVILPDEDTKDYTIGYLTDSRRDTSYTPTNIAEWCAQCHTRYLAGGGSGSNPSGDVVFKYRHATYGVSGCLECHVAHGTSATMGAYSGTVTWPDGDGPPGNARSYLLHSNNRGVCTRCHVM